MSFSAEDCVRARQSISAQLDGELSELEFDRLETHVRVCPACAAWADEVRDVTVQMRDAALEAPPERFVLPRWHVRSLRVSSAVALASAAAVVATMFFASGRQHAPLRSLAQPAPNTSVDVAAGVVYPPRALLGGTTFAASGLRVAARPVRDL